MLIIHPPATAGGTDLLQERDPELLRQSRQHTKHSVRLTKLGACLNQIGCDKCWSTEASDAWGAVTSIPIETHLIDESHYIVSIRGCPSCSQRYLQVTTETVDWEDGEDPIYRTIIPVNNAEKIQVDYYQAPGHQYHRGHRE